MELSGLVARVSGLETGDAYIYSRYNNKPVEAVGRVESQVPQNQPLPADYMKKAQEVQKDPVQKLSYVPGDIFKAYA